MRWALHAQLTAQESGDEELGHAATVPQPPAIGPAHVRGWVLTSRHQFHFLILIYSAVFGNNLPSRVDIIYELRDATDFVPSLKKPWWEELPEAHEGAWAARAARRKGRIDFRLAFIP